MSKTTHKERKKQQIRNLFMKVVFILIGTGIATFGIYNIHQQTNITEGGVLGSILLLHHWLGMNPSVITPVLDIICYAMAYKCLGKTFIKWSLFSTMCLAGFFKLWEQFPPVIPDLSAYPFTAAILGGIFVGAGVGIIIRNGGSSGGDDALALTISRISKWRLSQSYLVTDITVLLLSLSYIPVTRIAYSLVTVTVSSVLIDLVQKKNFMCTEEGYEEV